MKKNRLFVGFVSLVSLLALVGCSRDSGQSDAHRNELIHQFINAMKVGHSTYLAKGYKISFEQDYEVSYHSTSGESLIDYSLKRSSSGETSRFYEPSLGDSMDASGKRYNDGRGYFAGQQVESVDYLKKSLVDKLANQKAQRAIMISIIALVLNMIAPIYLLQAQAH